MLDWKAGIACPLVVLISVLTFGLTPENGKVENKEPPCKTPVFESTRSCYWVNRDNLSVQDALAKCQEYGGTLAILDSLKTDQLIWNLVQWPLGFFWIGASDLRQEGVFRWIDGSLMTWSSWRIYKPRQLGNEPNGPSPSGEVEGCVAQNGPGDPDVKWYDFPCGMQYPSLCQSTAALKNCSEKEGCLNSWEAEWRNITGYCPSHNASQVIRNITDLTECLHVCATTIYNSCNSVMFNTSANVCSLYGDSSDDETLVPCDIEHEEIQARERVYAVRDFLHCYNVWLTEETLTNFSDAVEQCIRQNGDPLSVRHPKELKQIRQILDIRESVWIGLTNTNTSSNFYWAEDSLVPSWTNWDGTPRDIDVKQCVVMDTHGLWQNTFCNNAESHKVVCYSEKETCEFPPSTATMLSDRTENAFSANPSTPELYEGSIWDEWFGWTECSRSCGSGTQFRIRLCSDPFKCEKVLYGQYTVIGYTIETRNCNTIPCICASSWTHWSGWSSCSATCGDGTRSRYRKCVTENQYGAQEVEACDGRNTEYGLCSGSHICPANRRKFGWNRNSWTESDNQYSSITIATTMIVFLLMEVFFLISFDLISCGRFLAGKCREKVNKRN